VVSTELLLRPAATDDADGLARVHLESRRAAVPAMPPPVHPPEEVVDHLAQRVRAGGVWVAEHDRRVVAYLDLVDGWLDGLYVDPSHAGQGIGSALLELAKTLAPEGFELWVFESNHTARRFYRSRGLVELEHTDGSGNEERSPDVRMAWPGGDPIAFLRRQIDEVDDELALLLARRFALTATVQDFKHQPGHQGRDRDRERAIAQRMAGHAPGLGADALGRIMDTVIGESLDAYEARSAD